MSTQVEQLRAALLLARPYVRLAAERLCSDANEERLRAEAGERLKRIDEALAATAPGTPDKPVPPQEAQPNKQEVSWSPPPESEK